LFKFLSAKEETIMANPTTPARNREEHRTSGPTPYGDEMRTKPQDTAAAVADSAREMASTAAGTAKETASSAADKAKDIASSFAEKTKEGASAVAHSVQDAATTMGRKAEDATSTVGSGMQSLAGSIRENLPREGMLGSASTAVAGTLESGGRYLQEEGIKGIVEDLGNLVRRNPIPALLLGIGIGYLIARSTRS
jgi:hypothetical protein